MNRMLPALGLALVVGMGVGLLEASQAKPSTIDAITAIDNAWAEAYVSCNAKTWDALLADDLVFIHNNGNIDDKAKQIASVRACPLESLKSAVTKVRVYGNDTAVVLGNMQGKLTGRDLRFDLLYTRVYIKQKGMWRLVSHQSTDAPKRTP